MKILIIRFSSIGDIILTTPIIRSCKEQLGAKIYFLCKDSFKHVLEANPYIDHILSFQKDLQEIKSEIKSISFDYIIDLHHNLRSSQVKRWLSAPSSSFNKLNIQKWILVNFKKNLLPEKHIVDRYFEAAKNLVEIQYDGKGLDYHIPEEKAKELKIKTNFKISKQFGILALGATYPTKQIPLDLARRILEKSNKPLVLVGGKDVQEIGHILEREFPICINTIGKTSLHETAFLIKNSRYVITGDTATMHIAAAFKKPTFSFWGNTLPEFGMYAFETERYDFEVRNLGCRPCSKLGHQSCPKGHFKCMMNQDAHLLSDKIEEIQ